MAVIVSVEELCAQLELDALCCADAVIEFNSDEINRPGLQFTGYYKDFLARRVQLIGNAEMHYLSDLTYAQLSDAVQRFVGFDIPCIVCARGQRPPKLLLEHAAARGIPVMLSQRKTGRLSHDISQFLERKLAPHILMHGVLMDVVGVGILITGDSGIGKSEAALEMLKSGHRLVADDVVEITRLDETLVGCAPELTRHLIEVRGIGVVDVRYLYGVGSVIPQKDIDMVLSLRLEDGLREYERMHMGERNTEILGLSLPCIELPVSPGRNIATIIEVAARKFRLKRMGYDSAGDFEGRINTLMEQKDNGDV